MIKLICGPKGTGKTKIILDEVEKAVQSAKGDIVFITDKKLDSAKINFNVRCVYAEEFGVLNSESFRGFVKGLMAGNSDIQYLFIDGVVRVISKEDKAGIEDFFRDIIALEKIYGFNVVLTASLTSEQVPDFMKGYIQ